MKGVDLLPPGLPKPPRTSALRIAVATAVFTFVLAASFLYTVRALEIEELRCALKAQEEDYARYAWLDRDIQATRKSKDEVLARLAAARKQVNGGLPAQEILENLSRLLPAGVRLVQFTLTDDGKARVDGEAASLEAVASLMLALGDSGLFKDVQLAGVSRTGEGTDVLAFQAQATLSRAGGEKP
ncbi:MAG: PilN domain-containing protein [Firmicutes bacterium]|nr:PilN domain-containing protein [Bacillota bacterium]